MIIPKTKKVLCVGVDLGKAAESTAIAVVQKITPVGWSGPGDCPADKTEYHVRHLERRPPGTYHLETARNLSVLLASRELSDTKELSIHKTVREIDLSVDLVIDQTAVGPPVADLIVREVGKSAIRVILAGTQAESYADGLYHIPKQSLIGQLEVLLETKRIKIAEGVPISRQLADELVNYRGRKTSVTNLTAGDMWREQPSDDLVFAVAFACWRLQKSGFSYEFLELW